MKCRDKRVEIWCMKCDARIVPVGRKCPKCGRREQVSKRNKQQVKADIGNEISDIIQDNEDYYGDLDYITFD